MSGIFKMIRKGNVKVNKKKKKQNYRLQEGDHVRVWEPTLPTAAKAFIHLSTDTKELLKRCVVYEDENIILCNKPAGMVMHAGSNHHHGLSELLISYTRNSHCTFVHRIDKMTSGLVMAARNLRTARMLSELIRKRAIEKKYVLLVHGQIKTRKFTLKTFLKTEGDRVRVHPDETGGARISTSTFYVIQMGSGRTLLEAAIHTGRKHQLRVQLADIGHPIIGDLKYGRNDKKSKVFLFSQSIKIPSLNLHVNLDVPDIFYSSINPMFEGQKKELL